MLMSLARSANPAVPMLFKLVAISMAAIAPPVLACEFVDASTKISPDDERARSTVQVGVNGIDCSGVIVPNEAKSQSLRVLTAAHCVVDWGVKQGQSFTATVSFNAIVGSTKRFTKLIGFTADYVGPPYKGQGPDSTSRAPDIALVSSQEIAPFGTRFSSLDASADSFNVGTPVVSLGFPATTRSGVTRDQQVASGAVFGYPDGAQAQSVKYQYGGSTGGSSGSPVTRNADLFLVGIVSGGGGNTSGQCYETDAVQPLFTAWSAIGPLLAPSGATVVQG